MSIFDLLWEKDITSEEKAIAYERCKHIAPPPDPTPEEELEAREKREECMRIQADILYYTRIQISCIKSGKIVEDDRFKDNKPKEWVNCWTTYPSVEEYIEEYGFNPNTECFHCEKDENGILIDKREICNPCNPCINFEYDENCVKWHYWFLVFDAKACRYWRNPSTEEVVWDCEEQAVLAWESDTPPKSKSKQQISFYDPTRQGGDYCPKDRNKITGDPEIDKYIPKTPNDFKWCVPRWNDQCRFFLIRFSHNNKDIHNNTISTSWKFIKKCNQEECDLAEENREGSSMNPLARHANLCINRCYDIDKQFAIYPEWQYDLVNYRHKDW